MIKEEYKWILIFVLIILGVAFYWFEYRPSEIRKRCSIVSLSAKDEELGYRYCLMDNGIKE